MNWTADETFYETFEFYVEGVLLMLVAVLGILGNIFFVLVFSCHAKRINTFHRWHFKLSLKCFYFYFDFERPRDTKSTFKYDLTMTMMTRILNQ